MPDDPTFGPILPLRNGTYRVAIEGKFGHQYRQTDSWEFEVWTSPS